MKKPWFEEDTTVRFSRYKSPFTPVTWQGWLFVVIFLASFIYVLWKGSIISFVLFISAGILYFFVSIIASKPKPRQPKKNSKISITK